MTTDSVSLIIQIFGVLVVSGSLLFVGLQMRQTHVIERANAQRDVLSQTSDWWMTVVEDGATFDTFCAGLADYASLSRYRQARFNALSFKLQHIVESVFFQHKAGLIMASSHEGFMIAYLAIINTPGGRQWWAEASKVGNAELCGYLSARLEAEAATLPLWTDLLPHTLVPPTGASTRTGEHG